jgi:hypothetical protein
VNRVAGKLGRVTGAASGPVTAAIPGIGPDAASKGGMRSIRNPVRHRRRTGGRRRPFRAPNPPGTPRRRKEHRE